VAAEIAAISRRRRHQPEDCQRAVDQAAAIGRCASPSLRRTGGRRVINRDGSPHELGPFEFIQRLNVFGTFNVMTKARGDRQGLRGEDGERGSS